MIKGFAFVEFDMPNSAQECIKTFRKKGRVLPSYVSPNELLSITTFDEPEKDAAVGVINSKAKARVKDNEKEKTSNEETEHRDNDREMDTGDGKQSFKKRKYSEKSITDESDMKVKKKKKEAADQNTTDQQDEGGKIPKAELEDKDNTDDNEIDAADNSGRQSSKKENIQKNRWLQTKATLRSRKRKKK